MIKGDTLGIAVLKKKAEEVKILLEQGGDPDWQHPKVGSLLLWALKNQQFLIAEHLASKTKKINEKFDGRTALSHAARLGSQAVVEILWEKGADANIADSDFDKNLPSHWAALNGHLEILKLLEPHINLDAVNESKNTALQYAVKAKHFEIVKFLVEKNANVNIKDQFQASPLQWAIEKKLSNIAEVLIPKIIDVNVKDDKGRTLLSFASAEGLTKVVELLLEKGADATICESTEEKDSPLHRAAFNGHLDIVKVLAEKTNVNILNDNWDTPMNIGINHPKIVKYLLLEKNADPDIKNIDGKTLIHYLADGQDLDILEIVASKTKNINEPDDDGMTGLGIAICEGSEEAVKCLLKYHADKNAPCDDGILPLHLAVKENQLRLLKHLISKVNINVQDVEGENALFHAVKSRNVQIIQYLVNRNDLIDPKLMANLENNNKELPLHAAFDLIFKASVEPIAKVLIPLTNMDALNAAGDTILIQAIKFGNLEIVREILKQKPNLNRANKKGELPLHVAVEKGNLNIVGLIAEHEDINAVNAKGQTALSLAIKLGKAGIAKYLVEHGADATADQLDEILNMRSELSQAAEEGNLDQVKDLLNNGADANHKDKDGSLPLHWAAFRGHFEIVKRLAPLTINIDTRDNDGATPLNFGVQSGNVDIVKYLLGYANPNIVDDLNNLPLHLVPKQNKLEITRLLIEKTENLDVENEDGTPLFLAINDNQVKVVELLLAFGAKANTPDERNNLLLHEATINGNLEIIKLLVSYYTKEEINHENNDGDTALSLAKKFHRNDIIEFLKEQGAVKKKK